MFERIIAPRRRTPTTTTPPLLASVAFHVLVAALLTGAVAHATGPVAEDEPAERAPMMLLPLLPSSAPPQAEKLSWEGGTSASAAGGAPRTGDGTGLGRRRGSGRQQAPVVPGLEPGPSDGGGIEAVFAFDAHLDRPVSRHPLAGAPEYPPELLEARVEGSVVAEFTVDEFGRADSASVVIAEVTHPGFEAAVRAAMPRLRFLPAEHGGRGVRQRVQQRYIFRVQLTDTLRT